MEQPNQKLTEREHQALENLSSSILSSWSEHHKQHPNVLYHYTSADGLIGILTSKSIWLTDLRYMNDLSELQYANQLIEKRLALRQESPQLSEIQREFVARCSGSLIRFSSVALCFQYPSVKKGIYLASGERTEAKEVDTR